MAHHSYPSTSLRTEDSGSPPSRQLSENLIHQSVGRVIETLNELGLTEDTGETNNLAKVEVARIREMRRELDAWLRKVGAEPIRPKPDHQKKR